MLALIDPLLVPNESEFLRKNTFRMVFHDFDWKLNDLTGTLVGSRVQRFKEFKG